MNDPLQLGPKRSIDHDSGAGTRAIPPADQGQLVEALRRGDETAFILMVERYHPALVRLARAYVHDPAVAEEVAQEAWLGLLESLPRFAGRASLKTWLFRILVNSAKASRRRESRTTPLSGLTRCLEDDDAPPVEPDRFLPAGHRWIDHWSVPPQAWPEATLLAAETRAYIARALTHLPSHQQAVLVLRDVEGWTAAEVCDVLGISAANQRVLLHRARSRARRELEAYVDRAREDGGRARC